MLSRRSRRSVYGLAASSPGFDADYVSGSRSRNGNFSHPPSFGGLTLSIINHSEGVRREECAGPKTDRSSPHALGVQPGQT